MVLCTDVAPVIDNSFGCCDLLQRSVIHYGARRKASSAIISTPHQGVTTGTVRRAVHLATLPKTIDEALGKAPNQPDRTGSAAPKSNAPASDVIAPPSKAATTAPRFYLGKSASSHRQEVVLATFADSAPDALLEISRFELFCRVCWYRKPSTTKFPRCLSK